MMQGNTIDFGSVQIHKTVLEEIVQSVIDKIDGVQLDRDFIGKKLFTFWSQRNRSGIDIKVEADQGVSIDLRVQICYGKNIPSIATEVQDAVKTAIEQTVDINLKGINVNVQGMTKAKKTLKKETKKEPEKSLE